MTIINFSDVHYSSSAISCEAGNKPSLTGITLSINKGEFTVVHGTSGSGKSTLLQLCNALLLPVTGEVTVAGINTRDRRRIWDIRRMVGMIFQNPDSQIIGATVVEDVAFGPENLGLPALEIQKRVHEALRIVEIPEFADYPINLLSTALKLRVSLAGIMAMHPECLLVDDVFTLLEDVERNAFLTLLRNICKEHGIAVIAATRSREIATEKERVILLENGVHVFENSRIQSAIDFSGYAMRTAATC